MSTWSDNAKKELRDWFANATPEEIGQALVDARYEEQGDDDPGILLTDEFYEKLDKSLIKDSYPATILPGVEFITVGLNFTFPLVNKEYPSFINETPEFKISSVWIQLEELINPSLNNPPQVTSYRQVLKTEAECFIPPYRQAA